MVSFAPKTENSEHDETFVQQMMYVGLELAVEVNHHVPAKNHVKFVERRIRSEIVLRENDVLAAAMISG